MKWILNSWNSREREREKISKNGFQRREFNWGEKRGEGDKNKPKNIFILVGEFIKIEDFSLFPHLLSSPKWYSVCVAYKRHLMMQYWFLSVVNCLHIPFIFSFSLSLSQFIFMFVFALLMFVLSNIFLSAAIWYFFEWRI